MWSVDSLSHTAAGEPTRLNAVDLLDTERILVTWTAPSGPVTGYTVFLQPGGVQETASAAATSHMFTNVQSGMSYMVTMVALSDQLPSSVVGPVSPTSKCLSLLWLALGIHTHSSLLVCSTDIMPIHFMGFHSHTHSLLCVQFIPMTPHSTGSSDCGSLYHCY